jgi:DNA-binding response OmpR family regulator
MSLENMSVLYAEDESELREVMAEILSYEIKTLYVAKDGLEAYEIYKQKKPDIIISDINMPGMNGIDLGKKIRETDHSTRLIMLTAYSDVDNLLSATELKLTKYLLKPTKGVDLFEALNRAVDEIKSFNVVNTCTLGLKDNYFWDFKEQSLYCGAKEIRLTPKERKILNMLFTNLNSTITYDMLIQDVWEDSDLYSIDTIKTMVKNIRKKLPKDTIKNVYGTGFKVE